MFWIFKLVCFILIKCAIPTEVLQWLTKEEMIKIKNNYQRTYPDFDVRLINVAEISSPMKIRNSFPEEKTKIRIFSLFLDYSTELSTERKNQLSVKKLQRGMIETLFYCATNRKVTYSRISYIHMQIGVRRYQCQGMYHYYQLLPIFMLLDDPKEAYTCMNDINNYTNLHKTHLTHWNTLYALIRNGRWKKLANWDLKVLAAYIKTYSLFFHSLFTHDIVTDQEKIIEADGNVEQELIREFEDICLGMKGQEDNYLSPFRCKVMTILCQYEISQYLDILEELHIRFYGDTMNHKTKASMIEGELSPLTIILKFIIDGHIKESTDTNDIENLFTFKEKLNKEISMKNNRSGLFEPLILRRGECLIINQIFQNDPDSHYYREGAEKDEESLVRTWKMIGCKDSITVKRNLSKLQIKSALIEFRRKLEKNRPDFMVIVIMSHGFRDKITRRDCIMDKNHEGMPISSIENMFIDGNYCPSMIGKPKFFFIQACRGKLYQEALSKISHHPIIPLVDFSETDGEHDEEKLLQVDGVKYAHKSWFFTFHSTIKGYVSLRDPSCGTIFIQALCKVLEETWFVNDIGTIATEVNKRIMKEYESVQAPIFENQLGNLVYFDAIKC